VIKHGLEHSKPGNRGDGSDLAALTGDTKTEVLTKALKDRLGQ
jgi:hypothetical protein